MKYILSFCMLFFVSGTYASAASFSLVEDVVCFDTDKIMDWGYSHLFYTPDMPENIKRYHGYVGIHYLPARGTDPNVSMAGVTKVKNLTWNSDYTKISYKDPETQEVTLCGEKLKDSNGNVTFKAYRDKCTVSGDIRPASDYEWQRYCEGKFDTRVASKFVGALVVMP